MKRQTTVKKAFKMPDEVRFNRLFGEIVREMREEKFVSLQPAAQAAEVSYEQMERIEAGEENLSRDSATSRT
jgi:predicted transcriptional regulator